MKVGIAGTGKIIPEAVQAMQETGIQVVSIWGRNPGKAAEKAQLLGIPAVSGSYDALLDSDIDFVYIGLVNSVHYEYAARALRKGVNVFLEKPFCETAAQALSLARLAEEKGLYLFETISNLHLPNWKAVKEKSEEIRPIRLFKSDFSQYSSRYDAYLRGEVAPAFDPSCGGGTLMDLNVYNLHLAVDLLGRPESVEYRCNRGFNGIDTSGAVILQYPGCVAICTAAKDSGCPSGVMIQGEKGWIRIEGIPSTCPSVEVAVRGSEPVRFNLNKDWHRLCHEFEAFRKIYESGDYDRMRELLTQNTLPVMEVLDNCR